MGVKKVMILGLHLGIGGVENAIISLANALCDDYDVSIVVAYRVLSKPIFHINEKVKVVYLTNLKPNKDELKQAIKNKKVISLFKEAFKSIKILFYRKDKMKNYIKKSDGDIIISTRILYNKMLGKYAKKNTVKIAQEHRYHSNDQRYIKKLKKSCNKIDYLMPVSNYLTDFYKDIFKDTKTKVLYGPLCIDYFPDNISKLEQKNIVSIGRFSHEKRFLDLIDVFKEINKIDNEWRLNIIGDGDEMLLIKEKIAEYGLEKCIKLCGFKDKDYIHSVLEKSSIYLMTSFEESFGLVLIEAMSFGIPCIAFDSALGAKEIINLDNGILIKNRDINEMAVQTINLFNNKEKLNDMSARARNDVEKYSFNSYKKFWLSFINEISK